MSLDSNVFKKNREFITKAADTIENGVMQSYGHELANCPDDLLKEQADGVGRTIARAIFEYLKLKKEQGR